MNLYSTYINENITDLKETLNAVPTICGARGREKSRDLRKKKHFLCPFNYFPGTRGITVTPLLGKKCIRGTHSSVDAKNYTIDNYQQIESAENINFSYNLAY